MDELLGVVPMVKSPESYSILQYVGIVFLAGWAGIVNYLRRMRRMSVPKFSVVELISEVATSGFAGILVFWLCEAAGVLPLVTAATVGIAGHIGGRSLILIEDFLMHNLPIIPSRADDRKRKFETLDKWVRDEEESALAAQEKEDKKDGKA